MTAQSRAAFEARLRRIGDERYHDKHPFHQLLHSGGCTIDQVRAWVINRYAYQSHIPLKDAAFLSRCSDPEMRRVWRRRIEDHDGDPGADPAREGGLRRWLRLAEGVGLDPDYVASGVGILPATRFAVQAYVRYVRDEPFLAAVAVWPLQIQGAHMSQSSSGGLAPIAELVEDIRQGRMVILMDDEDRENEGDLVMAAEHCTPEAINFMARFGRGLICMPMTRHRCEQLGLPLMVQQNASGFGTKFTLSIEATEGVTTGISAADRARTVQAAVARDAKASDLVQPGHIFPLMSDPGGVLSRAGHTEASCDLAALAGCEPAGVICEIMNDDGSMARREDLEKFAETHDLKIGTIADLIHYRTLNERTIECVEQYDLDTEYGVFNLRTYRDNIQGSTHLAMVMGDIAAEDPVLVRVHITDTLRDLLGARRADSRSWPLHHALEKVASEGRGVVVLLNSAEDSYNLEDRIHEFFEQDKKSAGKGSSGVYFTVGTGSQILRDLGVGKMRLLSPPIKFSAISGFELEVVEYVPYTPE